MTKISKKDIIVRLLQEKIESEQINNDVLRALAKERSDATSSMEEWRFIALKAKEELQQMEKDMARVHEIDPEMPMKLLRAKLDSK